ncbi:DUF2490 domain-containing protein [Olivibacter sitiensis]|uniref:DUF2490 domain-containing protein n=1 Tax=Olivibacter sitiensis TaxID=376470 RepID=UPI00042143E8|nr:DUF2490 domain-containing protein [Olivibacter sitiensis]
MRGIYIALSLVCFFQMALTQDRYQLGVMGSVNTKFRMGQDYELNTKLESRHFISDGPKGISQGNGFQYERTDMEMIFNRSLGPVSSVGAGYLFRLVGHDKAVHRAIQQFAIVQRLRGARLAHRFRTDQTWEDGSFRFRFRYRWSLEKALQGLEIDPKEFYLKINNECLPTFESNNSDIEIRALASLGYNFSDDMKLETGLDYRAEQIISPDTEHQCWLALGWYYSF